MGATASQPNRLPKNPQMSESDAQLNHCPKCCCYDGEVRANAPVIDFGYFSRVDGARAFDGGVVVLETGTEIETMLEEPAACSA